tara:strand:+ start:1803 stop:2342 length:540 start_codon:yes stop_codon:yes gene_type:complete
VPLPHRYQVFSVGVEHLLLLRKGKLMLPLRQKQKERPKPLLLLDGELPPLLLLDGGLPPLEELEKLPPLDGGLPPLGVKLNGDVENKRLPVKEPQLLEGEPNREQKQNEFVENPNSVRLDVGLNELLGELENPNSVGLDVGLNELSDVGVVERLGVGVVGVVEKLGGGVVGAVSPLRRP